MDNQFNNEKNLDAVICSEVLLYSFLNNPNKSYLDCVKEYLKKRDVKLNKKETREFCYRVLFFQQISLLREILCLVQNGVKRGRVSLDNPDFVKKIKELKEKTIVSGDKEITNYNYIKAIRNVLAHNNELDEEQLISFDTINGENKVIVKAKTEGLTIELSMADLHGICGAIFKSVKSSQGLGVYPKRFENAIVNGYFDVDNLGRYMKCYRNGEHSDFKLDEFQKKALLSYIKTGDVQDDQMLIRYKYRGDHHAIRLAYPDLMEQIFPFESKPEDLAFHKCFLFHTNNLIAEDLTRTKDDVVDLFNVKPDILKIFGTYCLNSDYSTFLSVSNGLYSVLSDRELEDVEPELIEKLGEVNARHVRNAMQHGTYYYNFNGGIEIYDGTKKFKHITTLNLSEVAYSMHSAIINRCRNEEDEK